MDLRRIPVSFGRAGRANLAPPYLTLEFTENLAQIDRAAFDAIHDQRANLDTKERIVEWVAAQGMDAKVFAAAFHSFAVQTRHARSDQLVRQYRIDGVPRLTVAGRCAVVGREAKGRGDLLVVADALIEQVRSHRGVAAPSASRADPGRGLSTVGPATTGPTHPVGSGPAPCFGRFGRG